MQRSCNVLISQHEHWAHVKQWLELMSERVKPKNFIPNQRIVKQGDEGDDMFILKEGKV